jgi:phosphoglucosamine mutase
MPADIVGSAMKANVSHVTMTGDRRLFGTDGIRGKANSDPMTAGMALRLGQAAGLWFTRDNHGRRAVIGKDTRLSGYMIEPALTAGLIGAGMNVTLLGPIPTPAVAMLTRSLRADLGVMISASHNPYEDNGIKLFGPDGAKLSDETELEIERLWIADLRTDWQHPRRSVARLDSTTPLDVTSRQPRRAFRAVDAWTD